HQGRGLEAPGHRPQRRADLALAPSRKAEQQAMVARLAERQAGERARFDACRDEPLYGRLIGAPALEPGDELDAAGGDFSREDLAEMTLQSLYEVIAPEVIEPSHPAQMREEMSVGDELRERLLDVTGRDQPDMPLRDLECADQRRRHHEIA